MDHNLMSDLAAVWDLGFPAEWVKSALVLALFGTLTVVGLFAYLNQHTRKGYFRLWTVAWLYYAMYLAASIGLEESPDSPGLVMVRRVCIGICALCMFWGSFQLAGAGRRQRELDWALVMMLVWSYVAAFKVREPLWITIPVFALLAVASAYTGNLYRQFSNKYRGANILFAGFWLWGLHLLAFPFERVLAPGLVASGYLATAVLALAIAMGMMMLVLEQAQERTENLRGAFKKNVAQRRLLQQEITVSEQKYKLLFDSASDAIFLVDLETLNIVEANQAAARLLDSELANLLGRPFADFCPTLPRADGGLLENKTRVEAALKGSPELHLVRANGARVLCEGRCNLVQSHQRPVLQINIREITERKRMEQQLRQAEKLSALGQLVAGVAHELNNPLTVVMGYAQVLSRQKTLPNDARNDLIKILHESERAAKIVRNLQTFARPREPQKVVVDLNQLVSEVLEARQTQLAAANIQLLMRLTAELPRTMADPNQIEQVLANLVTNAIQALSDHPHARTLEVATSRHNGAIRISVADSGPGIPQQILERIFDPFFTTRPPGKGTGLGLSVCYSIVQQHRGRLWVESEPGKGARFFLELPVVHCATEPEGPMPVFTDTQNEALPGQRRLLIVDDEPAIAELLKEILARDGCIVETVSDGAAALQRIGSTSYDLIISDLCMPEMNGEKLFSAITETYPHLADRVVFVTGDTVSPASRAFLERTGNRWLSKPFNIAEVQQLVDTMLRNEPQTAVSATA